MKKKSLEEMKTNLDTIGDRIGEISSKLKGPDAAEEEEDEEADTAEEEPPADIVENLTEKEIAELSGIIEEMKKIEDLGEPFENWPENYFGVL